MLLKELGTSPSQSYIVVLTLEVHLSTTLLVPHYPRASPPYEANAWIFIDSMLQGKVQTVMRYR